MLLRLLRQRGAEMGSIPGYQRRPIRSFIELSGDGGLLGFTENADSEHARGLPIPVPTLKRTVAARPLLLSDGPDYLFGLDDGGSRDARSEGRRALHLTLVRRCAKVTGNPHVMASLRFLEAAGDDPAMSSRVADLVAEYPGDLAVQVDGALVTDDSDVQSFWASEVSAGTGAGSPGECSVCHQLGTIPEMWPVPIKGIPGGQSSGTQLVSMNDDAFESYGQRRASSSMTCGPCAEAIANALNGLLADPTHRLILGKVAYVTWSRANGVFNYFSVCKDPQPELVRDILRSPLTTRSEHLEATTGDLVTLALTANASRVVVRAWDMIPIETARLRIREYFAAQMVVGSWGEEPQPVGIFAMAAGTARKTDDLPRALTAGLLRGIVTGMSLPASLISLCLRRIDVQDSPKVTHPQAALLTWYLVQTHKEMNVPHELDSSFDRPAYHCGRILAEMDAIQRSALGKVNATVVDRYFGAASSRPATVLGMLLRNSQDHLKKLRGNNEGAAIAHDRRLTEIVDCVSRSPLPATLSLSDQTLFCLGFYHQRAEERRSIQGRKLAAAPAGEADATMEETIS